MQGEYRKEGLHNGDQFSIQIAAIVLFPPKFHSARIKAAS